MTDLLNQWQSNFPGSSSFTAQIITVCLFAIALLLCAFSTVRLTRGPVIEDQPEHWGDDLPWPLRTDPRIEGNGAGVGGGERVVGLPNSVLHGSQK